MKKSKLMKKYVLFLALLYGCSSPQTVVLTMSSSDPADAHLSANYFADKVGDMLKREYPAKVSDVRVKVTKENGEYIFLWQCDIEKTTQDEAQFHFDRRGTFMWGNTKQEAFTLVEQEIQRSRKVQDMIDDFRDMYGGYSMPTNFVKTEYMQDKNRWWCLREFFCTARK